MSCNVKAVDVSVITEQTSIPCLLPSLWAFTCEIILLWKDLESQEVFPPCLYPSATPKEANVQKKDTKKNSP